MELNRNWIRVLVGSNKLMGLDDKMYNNLTTQFLSLDPTALLSSLSHIPDSEFNIDFD
jgi:hypothetical protein